MLDTVSRRPFYTNIWSAPSALSGPKSASFPELSQIPFLTKAQLQTACGVAAVHDLDPSAYVRWHQTSGTTGHPMIVRDTAEDWLWWLRCWSYVLDAANVDNHDIAMMAFSFGPFIGFWTAAEALIQRGTTVIPGGGLSSIARLNLIVNQRTTVLCATPTYAMHLASVAAEHSIDLRTTSVRRIIVAGEPGGSIAAVRTAIESAFDAVVIDHAGGSEIGAWGYGDDAGRGLQVIEPEFIAEVFDFSGSEPREISRDNPDRETGELVLTSLGRMGGPVIRYRTGDIVRPAGVGDDEYLFLDGGVLGRADDMIVIRGVNVFPSSIDAIVREICPREEYRVTVSQSGSMAVISLEIESDPTQGRQLAELFQQRLAMTVPIQIAAERSLPRFEAKANRWVHRATSDQH